MLFKIKTIYTVRVVYKSGYFHDFEVTEFKIKGDDINYTAADTQNRPLLLNTSDHIESVWQLKHRKKLCWSWTK